MADFWEAWLVLFLHFCERPPAASEVREAILPETTKKILTYVQDFGEGGRRPKAGGRERGSRSDFTGNDKINLGRAYHILGNMRAGQFDTYMALEDLQSLTETDLRLIKHSPQN